MCGYIVIQCKCVFYTFQISDRVMITLTELKSSLVQVLNGTITASSFASLAQQLNCEISSHLDVGKQRRLLQKQILVHIIRAR